MLYIISNVNYNILYQETQITSTNFCYLYIQLLYTMRLFYIYLHVMYYINLLSHQKLIKLLQQLICMIYIHNYTLRRIEK